MNIIRYKRVTSTNDKAKVLGEKGANEWTIVVAEVQTRGRGRAGKRWESREGGLWFSIILRPKISADKVSILQFLASNGLRRAVKVKTGVHALTKWPNDLVFKTGKLAGILVESKIVNEIVSFVIVGIGLNVNQDQRELPSRATSLCKITGRNYELNELMEVVIEEMKLDYDGAELAKITDEWWTNCVHNYEQVVTHTPSGYVKGLCVGMNTDGSILIKSKHRMVRVSEGSLKLVK